LSGLQPDAAGVGRADRVHPDPQRDRADVLVHASDDDEPGAQPEQSLALYRALRGAGVPVELHIYDEGGHGFGVRKTERPVSRWTDRCADWLRHRGLLTAGPRAPALTRSSIGPRTGKD